MAGLDHAEGDAVILMDGDLQDPPEVIPELLKKWREGHDVVNALKGHRPEPFIKRIAFRSFYSFFRLFSDLDLPKGCGLFSLMDRRVLVVLRECREPHPFVPGLRRWVGFRQCSITYERQARYAGKPRQSVARLCRMAFDAVLSFSSRPLALALWFGVAISMACLVGCAIIVYTKLFTDAAIPVWAPNMVTILFIGGVQLIVLAVAGQYICRIYDAVKNRPNYVIKSITGSRKREERNEETRNSDAPGQ
jgi:dolichol-phosphate mannosyltransferase